MYREHHINGNKARISHLLLEIRCTVTSAFKTFWLCLNSKGKYNVTINQLSIVYQTSFFFLQETDNFFNNKYKIRKKKRKHAQGNKNDFFFITWKWIHSYSIEKQSVIIFIYNYSMSTSEQIFCLIPCAIFYISYCNFAYNFARTRRSAKFNFVKCTERQT